MAAATNLTYTYIYIHHLVPQPYHPGFEVDTEFQSGSQLKVI